MIAEIPLYRPKRFNAESKERFFRDRRRRLTAHVGGNPDNVQKILIESVAALEWRLRRLNACADEAELSPHAARELLALNNHLRMQLSLLGPATKRAPPSLSEYLASKRQAPVAPDNTLALDEM